MWCSNYIPHITLEARAKYELASDVQHILGNKAGAPEFCGAPRPFLIYRLLILESIKKLEELFIAPAARQILHETAQRAFARCECAKHTGFLIKYFNQKSVLGNL